MKNPVKKLHDFLKDYHTALTYRVWDSKHEIWGIAAPKIISFPLWVIETILIYIVLIPLKLILLFMPSEPSDDQ